MGVPGTVKLLKTKADQLSTSERLCDSRLIIDATESMYWFVKKNLLRGQHERMDKFGFSMVVTAQFFRLFFYQLRAYNITPVVVFEGARLSRLKYGDILSKDRHLEKSARIRNMLLRRAFDNRTYHINHDIIPPLAACVIKQVIEDINREGRMTIETYQAPYETYPVLELLADRYACPVFTSHSDFILSSCSKGFVWAEEHLVIDSPITSQVSSTNKQPLRMTVLHLYQHRRLLQHYGVQDSSQALRCLYALLRPDFSGAYPNILNGMFAFTHGHLRFTPDETRFVTRGPRPRWQPCAARLEHILSNWPRDLRNPRDVRSKLQQLIVSSPPQSRVVAEYDGLYMSFSHAEPIDRPDPSNPMRDTRLTGDQISAIQSATKDRQATLSFLSEIAMQQRSYNRLTIEDLDQRSTFAVGDPVRLHLLDVFGVSDMPVMDLTNQGYGERILSRGDAPRFDPNEPADRVIYSLFRFPDEFKSGDSIERFQSIYRVALRPEYAKQFIVFLNLARFAFIEGRLGSAQRYAVMKSHWFEAVAVHFMHFAAENEDKMLTFKLADRSNLPAELNGRGFVEALATTRAKINNDRKGDLSMGDSNYLPIKHLTELFNSTLYHYIQLNSFKNYPAVKLEVGKYFCGPTLHRTMKHMMKPGAQTFLQQFDSNLYQVLMRD